MMSNTWTQFLKDEMKLARGTNEKFWEALPKSLTDKDRADIQEAAAVLGITVERCSKTGPLRLTWE